MKRRILILCTGNSARSQMAEGLMRHLVGDRFEVFSAGTKPSQVNPLAIRAMAEMGIDIGQHRSKHLNEFVSQPFDIVPTVCDDAAEAYPVFPGKAKRLHWSFPDPAAVQGNEAEKLESFRRVRDDIQAALKKMGDHRECTSKPHYTLACRLIAGIKIRLPGWFPELRKQVQSNQTSVAQLS